MSRVPFHWRDGRTTTEWVDDQPPPTWRLLQACSDAPDWPFSSPDHPVEVSAHHREVEFERRRLRNGSVEYLEMQDPSEAVR